MRSCACDVTKCNPGVHPSITVKCEGGVYPIRIQDGWIIDFAADYS